jgi:hypothetical protein
VEGEIHRVALRAKLILRVIRPADNCVRAFALAKPRLRHGRALRNQSIGSLQGVGGIVAPAFYTASTFGISGGAKRRPLNAVVGQRDHSGAE